MTPTEEMLLWKPQPTQIIDYLQRARRRLVRWGWTQGRLGPPCGPNCLVGALHYEVTETELKENWQKEELYCVATKELSTQIGRGHVSDWNDEEGRTFEQVLTAIDGAIAALEVTS